MDGLVGLFIISVFAIGFMFMGAAMNNAHLQQDAWLRTDKEREKALASFYEAESERFKKLALEAGK